MQRLTGMIRRCADDYDMIQDGDRIAVGVSGGKDSVALLCALAQLQKYYPKHFTLTALTLDMGYAEMDYTPIQKLCRELEVPYVIKHTEIQKIIFSDRKEKNPCALCAKMRKGALNDMMQEQGLNKIALGHHHDDAIETFFLSLFYEGRISCFSPVTYMSRTGVTQLRPMLYVTENEIQNVVKKCGLPVVKNSCPMDVLSKRHDVKKLVEELSASYPDLKSKVFGAMQRLPLEGWEPNPYERH